MTGAVYGSAASGPALGAGGGGIGSTLGEGGCGFQDGSGQDIILTGGFIAGSGGAGEEHGGCRHGDSTFGEGGCGFWDGSGCDLDLRTGGFITGSGGAGGGCGGCGGGGGGNFRLGRQGTLRLDCGFWVRQLLVTLA